MVELSSVYGLYNLQFLSKRLPKYCSARSSSDWSMIWSKFFQFIYSKSFMKIIKINNLFHKVNKNRRQLTCAICCWCFGCRSSTAVPASLTNGSRQRQSNIFTIHTGGTCLTVCQGASHRIILKGSFRTRMLSGELCAVWAIVAFRALGKIARSLNTVKTMGAHEASSLFLKVVVGACRTAFRCRATIFTECSRTAWSSCTCYKRRVGEYGTSTTIVPCITLAGWPGKTFFVTEVTLETWETISNRFSMGRIIKSTKWTRYWRG